MQGMTAKRFAILVFVFTAIVVNGCSADAQHELFRDFPVPEEARDVKKLALSKDTEQLYIRVDANYPSLQFINIYRSFLAKTGWVSCSGINNNWRSHEDRTSKEHFIVHEMIDYWVDLHGNRLLILAGRYYSHDLSRAQPDNNEQHIILWVQSATDPKGELLKLGIECSGSD